MLHQPYFRLLYTLILITSFTTIWSQVSFTSTITSNCVFQRNQPIIIKGYAASEDKVSVQFASISKDVSVENGKWTVDFPPMNHGGPYQLKVVGIDSKVLDNIMVGEVYLCSGQSNMEWPLGQSKNADYHAKYDHGGDIRIIKLDRNLSNTPIEQAKVQEGWQIATPEVALKSTAIGYILAKYVHDEKQIPIGIIDNSWGGSAIAPYMSEETFADKADYKKTIEEYKNIKLDYEAIQQKRNDWSSQLDITDIGLKNNWDKNPLSTSSKQIVPGKWEQKDYPDYDGAMWYQTTFQLPRTKDSITLFLGAIDDSDFTYINGKLIGSTERAYNQERIYKVGPNFLKKGKNSITIRVLDYRGGGGITASEHPIGIQVNDKFISLEKEWDISPGHLDNPPPYQNFSHNTYPTSKYNALVYPLLNHKLSAILWYQGESDTNDPHSYRWKFIRIIEDYRNKWQQARLPFIFVQLAGFQQEHDRPQRDSWAELRDAQQAALSLQNTAMATAIDLGDADDIHPRDKESLAQRMLGPLFHFSFGDDIKYGGPEVLQVERNNEGYLITFTNVGSNLMDMSNKGIPGFSIPTPGGDHVYAKGKLLNENQVFVPSTTPIKGMIRYLWAANPGPVYLFNDLGYPAPPFQYYVE